MAFLMPTKNAHNLLLSRVAHDNHIGTAGGGGDLQVDEFSLADGAFHGGLQRGVEFEVRLPILGPGRQKEDAFAIGLQEHVLEREQAVAAVVLVGHIVMPLGPEGRETHAVVFAGEMHDNGFPRRVHISQQGGLHGILRPATGGFEFAGVEGGAGDFDAGLAQAVNPERVDGI